MKKQYFKNFRKEGLPGGPNELIINSEGFILSENGQWEFPGLPTVIPSSDITMEDVPYPVLGISDTGDTQMMYPEEDYQFDGDMVYELPMAQKGYNVKPRKGSILVEGETEPSTHLMRREYIPNTGWVAFPSLFQNEDGTWVDMSKEEDWMNIYDEANRRGEVYNFGENKRKAIKFADKGSWKKDLGIKKQGGGDISIPDLTKPNWLNNLPKAQNGKGLQTASDSLYHQLGKIADYEFNLGRADGTGLTNYGNPKLGSNPSKKQAVDWILDNTIPIVKKYYTSPTEQAEAADFVYNTGRDPRIYQLDQYLKSIGQSGLPDRGSFNMDYYGDPDPNSKTKLVELDKLWNQYKDNIQKLSENDRRILLNKGRDFYYRNINKKSDGSPSDAYYNTWYGRIWNTNDYTDFNRNNPNFKPKKQKGGWLDTLPKAQSGKTREPIYVDPNDLLGMQRYNAYNDSLNLYNRGERNYQTRLAFNRANNIPTSSIRTWNDPIAYDGDSPARIQPIQGNGYFFNHSPDVVARTNIPSSSVDNYGFRYKKPVQPYAIRKTEPRIPYSPVQINQLNTVQLPINNIPLQQMPTIGIGEPTFEGNNAYWKKQDNQLIYQNNDYSNNRNLPISNKPGDRFHQEPSWMVGDDRYYERDGEAYLVPQPKGGWSRKQILDPSSGKWKSKIVKKQKGGGVDELQDGSNTLYHSRKPIEGKQDPYQLMRFIKSYIGPNDLDIQERPYKKPIPSYKDLYKDIYYDLYPDQIRGDKKVQKGGWLDTLPKAQNGKMLTREKKRLLKEKEFEDFLKKSSVDEQGTLTYVLPEYTVKSPEKKLYDEAYNKSIAQQQAFQNSWYPGSTDSDNLGYAPGVMDNIKQRATVKANDFVAKNLVNNNKIGDLKDYQKDYIATSNYSGKLRPNIGKQFTEGVQDLSRITQGKLPTSKSLGILSPLEYPVNLVRGTVKGEGVDALKGNISSPWLDANDVDPGAVNEVGVYNTMTDLALDPLNFSGAGVSLGKSGVKYLNKALKTSKESGVLSNTYKLNPWAFKPNPEAYYRGVGKEGIEDALKTGLIRSKNMDMFRQPYFARPGEFETALYYNPEALVEAKGFDVLNLKGKGPNINLPKLNFAKADAGALPVTSKYTEGILGKPETRDWYFDWDVESIPVNHPDIKLLQKDWLRGYKEVPKNLPSNISPVQSGFPNRLGINRIFNAIKGTKTVANEIMGEFLKGPINRKAIKEGNNWLDNWIKHPTTQQKIDADMTPLSTNDYIYAPGHIQAKKFKPNSKEYPLLKQIDQNLQQYLGNKNIDPIHEGNWGVSYTHIYDPYTQNLISNGALQTPERFGSWISRSPSMDYNQRLSTTIHEGTHDWVNSHTLKTSKQKDFILDNINKNIKEDYLTWNQNRRKADEILGKERSYQAYLADPTEVHARIMELRKHFNLTPDIKITEDMAKKMIDDLKSNSPIDKKGFLNVIDNDPKKLANLFNRLWAVPPAIIAGEQIQNQNDNKKQYSKGGWLDKL